MNKPLPKSRNQNVARAAPPARKKFFWPMILMLLAWGAVGFNFIDRHWLAGDASAEIPLGPENARLEMGPRALWQDATKSFYMNFDITNAGKNTANRMIHYGLAQWLQGPLDPDMLDAYFIMAKAKLKKITPTDNEFPPGPTNQFFSIPDTTTGLRFGSDENYQAAKDGKLVIYVLAIGRYRDESLDPGKYIYTERCIYLVGPVIHFCEQGHNRSYISD